MKGLALYRPSTRDGVLPIAYVHALARLGHDGLVLIEPTDSFVSVGYFDATAEAVDIDACRRQGLPVVRREIGGGPVLLGPGQVFYNLVLPRSDPVLPPILDDIYRYLSEPVIETYRHFGVDVQYRPINDLVTAAGRKITGQGAADIADRFCFVGAVLRHFDIVRMASVIRVPDEKLRAHLRQVLDDNVTSISREIGREPSTEDVIAALEHFFSLVLGPLDLRPLPPEVEDLAAQLAEHLQSADVLFEPRSRKHVTTKIREGVVVRHGQRKAQGGYIRSSVTIRDNAIADLQLSGDFTFIPKSGFTVLVQTLVGAPFEPSTVRAVIDAFFLSRGVECPGVTAADFTEAITGDPGTASDRS